DSASNGGSPDELGEKSHKAGAQTSGRHWNFDAQPIEPDSQCGFEPYCITLRLEIEATATIGPEARMSEAKPAPAPGPSSPPPTVAPAPLPTPLDPPDAERRFGWTWPLLRVALVVGVGFLTWFIANNWNRWTGALRYATTDDAYMAGDVTPLAAKV